MSSSRSRSAKVVASMKKTSSGEHDVDHRRQVDRRLVFIDVLELHAAPWARRGACSTASLVDAGGGGAVGVTEATVEDRPS